MKTKKRLLAVVSILIALLFVSVVISHLSPNLALGAEDEVASTPPLRPNPVSVENPYMIADIVEAATPATVFISVEWPLPEQEDQRGISPQDPFSFFFDYWFNEPFYRQPQMTPTSAGSGFIIDDQGIILTNQHVVGSRGENQTIKVLIDAPGLEREYEADIIGSDLTLDLAVLQIRDSGDIVFPAVPLGDSDASRIGEWTIAIGNPYGQDFEHTVTVGVLSAKGRKITILDRETGTTKDYGNLMQTDAAINRGNSGGPLLNLKGEVIGINTAVHAQAQGIGFAIPINVAKEVLDDLITTGEVQRAWLGIYYQNLTETLAKQLRLPDEKGVVIADVVKGSPAEKAGLKPWDLIRRIGERDIFELEDVQQEIIAKHPGDEILLTVFRRGEVLLITATLGNEPPGLR